MRVGMENCLVLGAENFTSKGGTRCGSLRWLSQDDMKCYRTMVFGEDSLLVEGLVVGSVVTLTFELTASRRDDTIGLTLVSVGR